MESDECFEPTSALEWLKGDSSYSDTGSEEGEQFEGAPAAGEQSSARVGIPPAPPSAPDGGPGGPAVRDIAWRNYRRTLEWRCRWVELRVLELRGQEAHYAGLEARLLERKRRLEERQTDTAAAQAPAAEGEGGVVRCAASSAPPSSSHSAPCATSDLSPTPQPDGEPLAVPVADRDVRPWRRRRVRAGAAGAGAACFPGELESPLSAPLQPLSLLCRRDDAALSDGSESDLGTGRLFEAASGVQAQVSSLFALLSQQRAAAGLPPAPARRQHTVRLAASEGGRGGGQGGRGAGGPALRRPSDSQPFQKRRDLAVQEFDISDVVGALGGGPKVIERAPHVDIATPGVRKAQPTPWELPDARAAAAARDAALACAAEKAMRKGAAKEEGGSSSEETGDEAYAQRHAPMEALEKKLRFGPAIPGRGSGAVARGMKSAAAAVEAAIPGEIAIELAGTVELVETPNGPSQHQPLGCAAAEWTVTRGDGPRRAHVLSIKRLSI